MQVIVHIHLIAHHVEGTIHIQVQVAIAVIVAIEVLVVVLTILIVQVLTAVEVVLRFIRLQQKRLATIRLETALYLLVFMVQMLIN